MEIHCIHLHHTNVLFGQVHETDDGTLNINARNTNNNV